MKVARCMQRLVTKIKPEIIVRSITIPFCGFLLLDNFTVLINQGLRNNLDTGMSIS
jgi:hypothetical protein